MEEAAVNQQTDMPYTAPRHREHDPIDESTQPPPASTSHSEARNLLLLSTIDARTNICFITWNRNLNWNLQRTGPTNAAHCLSMPHNSLRIRVEARANTVERAMIEQQLQFMQSRVQPVSTEDLRTDDTSCPSRTYADHFMSQDHSH